MYKQKYYDFVQAPLNQIFTNLHHGDESFRTKADVIFNQAQGRATIVISNLKYLKKKKNRPEVLPAGLCAVISAINVSACGNHKQLCTKWYYPKTVYIGALLI